jgi:histidyl-tRNA synthetase
MPRHKKGRCFRNMDIVGVPEVSAEAELLSAIVVFLERVGLSSSDITIKVSSRKVLQAVLERYHVPSESFGAVCIVVDKLDKLPMEKVGIPQILLYYSKF